MRVALRRQEAVAAIAGPSGAADMRIARLAGGDVRRDPAALADALRERGFFPGRRVVIVEDATDASAEAIGAALSGWAEGDAQMVVTAGPLKKTSALRRLFESHPSAVAIGIYDDPPDRAEIDRILAAAGVTADRDAMADLVALAAALDPGDFRQTVDKLALFMLAAPGPATAADVAAIAPATVEGEVGAVLAAAAEGRDADLPPALRSLGARSGDAVRLAQLANQHFRRLLAARSDPGGPEAGVGSLRPPVYGTDRDRLLRQVRIATADGLVFAVAALTDAELSLRSSSRAPESAVLERVLVQIAHRVRRDARKAAPR